MSEAQAGPPQALPLPRALSYAAGNVGTAMLFAFANAALPLYLATYGLPNAVIGLLAQERSPIASVIQPLAGALSDRTRTRFGRRRPYFLAIPAVAVALLVLAVRPPLPVMLIALSLMGPCLAVAYSPYLALLVDLAPEGQRGRIGSVLAVANMIGQIVLLWLASQFWEREPGLVFVVVAAALMIGYGVTFAGIREPPVLEPPGPRLRFRPADYWQGLLAYPEVLKYLLAVGLFWLGTGGVVPFLTRFAVHELGTDEGTAFRLLMVAIVSTALFAVPAGMLGDRYGKKPVLLAGLAAFGAVTIIGSQVQTVEQAVLAMALVGVGHAMCTVLLFPLLADLIPRQRAAELTGLGSAVWELAQPIGAVLAGLTADATGTLRGPLLVGGLLALVSFGFLLPVRTR